MFKIDNYDFKGKRAIIRAISMCPSTKKRAR